MNSPISSQRNPIVPGGVEAVEVGTATQSMHPLTSLQGRILYSTMTARDCREYSVQVELRFFGNLDLSILRQAWNAVISRRSALRSCFAWKSVSLPARIVRDAVPIDIDYEVRVGQADEGVWRSIYEHEWRRGFDVTRAPLMRVKAVKWAEAEHRILWTYHHLLLDGWSLPIVLSEVVTVYRGLLEGRPVTLQQDFDFARFHAEQESPNARDCTSPSHAQPLEVEATHAIPSGCGGTTGHKGGVRQETEVAIPEHLANLVMINARKAHVSQGVAYQFAWAVLLARLCGSGNVAYGILQSGRMLDVPGMERAVGMFIRATTLEVKLELSRTLSANLGSLHLQNSQILDDGLPVERDGGAPATRGKPPFDTLFVYENYPEEDIATGSASWRVERAGVRECNDIAMTAMVILGRRAKLKLLFDAERYERWFAREIADSYLYILEAVSLHPETPISELSMLSATRREALVRTGMGLAVESPAEDMVRLIEGQAQRKPTAVAVADSFATLTYAQLNDRANQIARVLMAMGVENEAFVGVLLDRSTAAVAALLGIVKAGGAYVPLDPNAPGQRLEVVVRDANPRAIVTREGLLPDLHGYTGEVLCIDRDAGRIDRQSASTPDVRIKPDSALYCIYTSGSTGRPKGVVGTHRGLSNRIRWMQRAYPISQLDVICQKTSLSFVDSVWEIFGALSSGATVEVVPDPEVRNPQMFLENLSRRRITHCVAVPSFLRKILSIDGSEPVLANLKMIVSSGEVMDGVAVERLACAPDFRAKILNIYGCTEVAGDCTAFEYPLGETPEHTLARTIGRPLDNTDVYVLDSTLNVAPIGAIGEICVGGAGLARGYWNRSDLTAERFLPHPCSNEPGARIYRTGDMGRYLPSGELHYLGRLDRQVKINGIRVEIAEIELAIREHPSVQDCAVVARAEDGRELCLVAYVVARDGMPVRVVDLHRWTDGKLPKYMIPATWQVLKALPLTQSGKTDIASLENRPLQIEVHARSPWRNSQTAAEIARIWADVLQLEHVENDVNFFDAGGDSLDLIKVHAELLRRTGKMVPMLTLLQLPTVDALAAYLNQNPAVAGFQ